MPEGVINIVTYRSIARQRLGKHIPTEAYARNNGAPIVRQRISKQAFSTIETEFSARPVPRGCKATKKIVLVVIENWVEFWRWQSKVIETK
jgi:hypothetical protein